MLTVSSDDNVRIWDIEGLDGVAELRGHTNQVSGIEFSRDSRYVVTTGWDATASIWETTTGKPVARLTHEIGSTGGGFITKFNPEGRFLIGAGVGKDAPVWDVRAQKIAFKLQGHTRYVNYAEFSRDGKVIVSASSDGTARVWDAATGAALLVFNTRKRSPLFRVDDIENAPKLLQVLKRGLSRSEDRFRRGERTLADYLYAQVDPDTLEQMSEHGLFDKPSPELLSKFVNEFNKILKGPLLHKAARFRDVRLSKETVELLGKNPTGDDLIRVNRLLLEDAYPNEITPLYYGDSVRSAVFSPDGRLVLTITGDGTAQLWRVSMSRDMPEPVASADEVSNAVFSPDGRLILMVSTISKSRRAFLFDVNSGRIVTKLTGHTDMGFDCRFSPDGRRAVTVSYDKLAIVWDVTTGIRLTQLPHDAAVRTASFSADGRLVLTTCDDQGVRLWDVQTGDLVRELIGHKNRINGAEFSPDGHHIATVGWDMVVRLYPEEMFLPFNDLKPLVAARLTRDFSSAEREKYLHEAKSEP